MRIVLQASVLIWLLGLVLGLQAQEKKMKPEETEVWEPVPEVIKPGEASHQAPSDAIVLFDGSNLDAWESASKEGGEAKWTIADDAMTVKAGTGAIKTKQNFGSCQLHIEWRSPKEVKGNGQGRGNSGVFLMGTYEVQVLDNYNNPTYSNGQAASLYKQSIPLVNACRAPGEWQSYDIIFTAPRFYEDGSLASPAYVTVIHNGVLVQNHVQLKGPTVYIGIPEYKEHGKLPLMLQDHGNPVSFRNVWIREL
ncbi:MAG: DUF1080 domain-containing protein [Bacteroidota bacterium]